LVNILILIDKISEFTKNIIDLGKTPLDIYVICSIIRESFCCSYSIRKNNNLYIYFDSTQSLIKFEGNLLRYLGSDERSQALLLKRAIDNIYSYEKTRSNNMHISTPGIFIKKLKRDELILENITNLNYNKIIIINDFNEGNMEKVNINIDELDTLGDYCYVFPFSQNPRSKLDLLRRIDNKYRFKYTNLFDIKGIENKILYINFLIDQQENLEK
jgi:tRNA pseudouridine-54 N-methylase